MNGLIEAALDRSRTVLLTLLLLLIAGTAAYVSIPKESDPDVAIPIIYITMTHEGISPEDAEPGCWCGRWNRSFSPSRD